MGSKRAALLTGFAAGAFGATPAWGQAAPPPLVVGSQGPVIIGPNGQPYTTNGQPLHATVVSSERGLNIVFTDLTDIEPTFWTTFFNGDGTLHPIGGPVPRYGFQTGNAGVSTQYGHPQTVLNTTFAYRLFETTDMVIVNVGGGITANVRAGGVQLASATATNAASAQALALGQIGALALPGRRLPAIVTGSGVTESTSETRVSAITGRDTYVAVVVIFGPDNILIGSRGQCQGFLTDCQGGITYGVGDDETNFNDLYLEDIYVTHTITRTITSSGTITLEIPFAAYGRAHPGAQVAGFDMASRFLTRLREAGSGANGVSLGKVTMFLEGTATGSHYAGQGAVSPAHGSSGGVRGGLGVAAGDGWTLGLAGEWAQWRWQLADTILPERAGDDLWRVGGYAGWRGDRWRATLALFGGRQQIATTAGSTLGGGTSTARYAASVYGAGGEIGYAIPAGPVTVTPSLAVDWVRWHSPAFSETGGLAPLSVAAANRSQWRPSVGLAVDHQGHGFRIGASARGFLVEGDRRGLVKATDGVTAGAGAFAIAGPLAAGSGAELGAHASIAVAPNASIELGYAARLSDHVTTHAGQAGLRVAF